MTKSLRKGNNRKMEDAIREAEKASKSGKRRQKKQTKSKNSKVDRWLVVKNYHRKDGRCIDRSSELVRNFERCETV